MHTSIGEPSLDINRCCVLVDQYGDIRAHKCACRIPRGQLASVKKSTHLKDGSVSQNPIVFQTASKCFDGTDSADTRHCIGQIGPDGAVLNARTKWSRAKQFIHRIYDWAIRPIVDRERRHVACIAPSKVRRNVGTSE
jgi:hypothetical protein